MDDKITIIEGPPPTFESIHDGWAMGLNESPFLYDLAVTHLRTFNGPALVERCYRTWHELSTMYLEYRNPVGLELRSPIMAVRNIETPEGNMLILWVRRDLQEAETESGEEDEHDDSGTL